MNEAARHAAILSYLEEAQFASVNDLTGLLPASAATIRRDIAKLDQLGNVRKVHGGIATITNGSGGLFRGKPYRENEVINVEQKQAIAREAAELCSDGDTVFIHAGTTCSIFSASLQSKSLRIYTNSIAVAENVWRSGRSHLHLLGGDLHRESAILHSAHTWSEGFFVTRCFVGTLGLSGQGLTENDPLLAHVIDNMVGRSNEVVVLADSSKFSIRARILALAMERISILITDDRLSDKDAQMIESGGVQLIVARTSDRA